MFTTRRLGWLFWAFIAGCILSPEGARANELDALIDLQSFVVTTVAAENTEEVSVDALLQEVTTVLGQAELEVRPLESLLGTKKPDAVLSLRVESRVLATDNLIYSVMLTCKEPVQLVRLPEIETNAVVWVQTRFGVTPRGDVHEVREAVRELAVAFITDHSTVNPD